MGRNSRTGVLGWCYLCEEDQESPPVAVCHRCGAFVCRKHCLRLLHVRRQSAAGFMSPRKHRQQVQSLEIICEACSLSELWTLEAVE